MSRPEPDWTALTARALDELKRADERYQPTNFWGPALEDLLGDMDRLGMENFKSWPRASAWFYPVYVAGVADRLPINRAPGDPEPAPVTTNRAGEPLDWVAGRNLARRDFDVARVMWDRERWPFTPARHHESLLGNPPERFPLLPRERDKTYGRAWLNYLLCLSALSRHVDAPPRSFLEIGGGYGALGEILLANDPGIRYVDLDIPPLLTVASWYLHHRFPDRDLRCYDDEVPADGPFTLGTSGVLPNYRIGDLQDQFEVFVNTFSFQEMEPDVVQHYIDQVCAKGVRYVVSLNSVKGKPKADRPGAGWGALDPVRTRDIVDWFTARGFRLVGEYADPLVRSSGKVVVLKRDDAPAAGPGLVSRVRRKVGRLIAG